MQFFAKRGTHGKITLFFASNRGVSLQKRDNWQVCINLARCQAKLNSANNVTKLKHRLIKMIPGPMVHHNSKYVL